MVHVKLHPCHASFVILPVSPYKVSADVICRSVFIDVIYCTHLNQYLLGSPVELTWTRSSLSGNHSVLIVTLAIRSTTCQFLVTTFLRMIYIYASFCGVGDGLFVGGCVCVCVVVC